MAATAEARRLTEAHRLAQARLGATVVAAMQAVWPLLDPADLDGSVERWLRASSLIVSGQRSASTRLAGTYVQTFKSLELGATAPAVSLVLAETEPQQAVVTSLVVTGPTSLKAALRRGTPITVASPVAQARSAASAMRHVLNGGRDTIVQTVDTDRQAKGWARVVSGSGCAFCAMLASRGPIYKGGSVSFDAHDGCLCGAEPVYRDDADWPVGARRYRALWDDATTGIPSTEDPLNAFRRALTTT